LLHGTPVVLKQPKLHEAIAHEAKAGIEALNGRHSAYSS